MYIRLKTSPRSKHPTVQIVQSYREQGKVKQRVVSSLGVVGNDADKQRLINVAHALINKLEKERPHQTEMALGDLLETPKQSTQKSNLVNPKNLVHVRTEPCGFESVYGALSKEIGFSELLETIDAEHRYNFAVKVIVEMLMIKRIQSPVSKRRSLFLEFEDKGFLPWELHQIYRAMDAIVPYTDKFQEIALYSATDLLNRNVECFFYDATTLYFESVWQDELRDFGFGKDGKFNQVQVLFCLVVTEEGLPVGFEIFSGKTSENKTLQQAVENLSKRYNVSHCTIVCDRGMLSGANLDFAERTKEMFFIVGEKLRKLPQKYHDLIFDKASYRKEGERLIKEIPHPTREKARLILSYSEPRAKKDKSDRERLLKKLQKKLDKKQVKPEQLISNRGVKKFVSVTGGSVTFNREAIAKDEKWDGFLGIVTNHPTLKDEEVLYQYKGLWQVEATIRVEKHDLRARPVFHWTPNRIRSHILICFNALVLERQLELRLKRRGTPLTVTNIHDALNLCHKIIFQEKITNRLFEMDSNKPSEAKKIYEAVGIPWRSQTRELPTPPASVVPSVVSVIPEVVGLPGEHI